MMLKNFSYLIFLTLKIINKVFFILTRRSFFGWLLNFISKESYNEKKIVKKKIKFFSPNNLISWRVRTIFEKEPDTIKWIDNFDKSGQEELIFWDVGANIGLYSLYCACRHDEKTKIYAFEPSTSNLRVLSRNIFVNGFKEKIIINQLPLTNKPNMFLPMKENSFEEGLSLNTYGENFDFEGKQFLSKNEYSILGNSIDYLIENKIMEIPDYIKIDVDGIEHIILEGGVKTLNNKKIKSILIEINENFIEQTNQVNKFMKRFGFILKNKFVEKNIPTSEKFSKTFNRIYERK